MSRVNQTLEDNPFNSKFRDNINVSYDIPPFFGDKKILLQSLERIQRTSVEVLLAVMGDDESKFEAAGRETCMAVAA